MKLGNFLSTAPAPSAPKELVSLTVFGQNRDARQVVAPAHATWRLVSAADDQAAQMAALAYVRDKGESAKLGFVPSDQLKDENVVQFVAAALRDYEEPRERFATADELRSAVTTAELARLRAAYDAWEAKWYPPAPTLADRKDLEAEAGKS